MDEVRGLPETEIFTILHLTKSLPQNELSIKYQFKIFLRCLFSNLDQKKLPKTQKKTRGRKQKKYTIFHRDYIRGQRKTKGPNCVLVPNRPLKISRFK